MDFDDGKILIKNYVNVTKSLNTVENIKKLNFSDLRYMVAKDLDSKTIAKPVVKEKEKESILEL